MTALIKASLSCFLNWNFTVLNAGVTGLLCSWNERYSNIAAGAQQGLFWCVTQKNKPTDQFQVTAPFQSHNLQLHYKRSEYSEISSQTKTQQGKKKKKKNVFEVFW